MPRSAAPRQTGSEAGVGEPIRVLIADDHALFRRGLEMVLAEEPGIDLVETARVARATSPASRKSSAIPVRAPSLSAILASSTANAMRWPRRRLSVASRRATFAGERESASSSATSRSFLRE